MSLLKAPSPVFAIRAVHFDLKGAPPTPKRFTELLELVAAVGYNAILIEWEDTFPWTVDERFRSETAYTPVQVRQFHAKARDLGLEIIPLVQCLGHAETPLSVPGYEHLREVPHHNQVINPLADGARELVEKMVQDVLSLTGDVKHFHLGGDEAWTFGTHPDTKAYIDVHGKAALYLHHVEPILDLLNAKGIRPILWHDMMCQWSGDQLHRLAEKADLCVWGYLGHPDNTEHHYNTKYIQRFFDHDVPCWAAGAYKGAHFHLSNMDLPMFEDHQENTLAWVDLAQRYPFLGIIITAWSRYSTGHAQCTPIDAALDSLVNVATIVHDGCPPAGGLDACLAELDALGQKQLFTQCKAAMTQLADLRRHAWWAIQDVRELHAMIQNDSRRQHSLPIFTQFKRLTTLLETADQVTQTVRQAFAGLIDDLWIDRYRAERLEPIRQQHQDLGQLLKALDPTLYHAECTS